VRIECRSHARRRHEVRGFETLLLEEPNATQAAVGKADIRSAKWSHLQMRQQRLLRLLHLRYKRAAMAARRGDEASGHVVWPATALADGAVEVRPW
jgi:hypothetical protein